MALEEHIGGRLQSRCNLCKTLAKLLLCWGLWRSCIINFNVFQDVCRGSSAPALLDADCKEFYTCRHMSVSYIEGCLYSIFKHIGVQCRISWYFLSMCKERGVSGSVRMFDFRVYLFSPVLDKICVGGVIEWVSYGRLV